MCTPMANRNTSLKMAAKINVGQTLESKTIMEVLTQLMRLVCRAVCKKKLGRGEDRLLQDLTK